MLSPICLEYVSDSGPVLTLLHLVLTLNQSRTDWDFPEGGLEQTGTKRECSDRVTPGCSGQMSCSQTVRQVNIF